MEIKLPLICGDETPSLPFADLKLLIADEYVFFDGFEQIRKLRKEDDLDESIFNSILSDPGDITLLFPTKELYLFAKTIVAFYEMGGIRPDVE